MYFAIVTNDGNRLPIRADVLELMLDHTISKLGDTPSKDDVANAMIAAYEEIEELIKAETVTLPPGLD